MFTFGTHFQELLKNIKPPEDRLQAAIDLPPLVRSYLEKHEDFTTVAPHTRLVGSYAQHMAVGDVKDVDFLVNVPGDPHSNKPEARKLVQDLRSALDGLPEAIGYEGWAGVDIERARRSVHVYLRGRDFHLDVVPCIAPGGFDDVLYVPDRGFNKWIPSHPIGYITLLEELNQKHGEKVRPLGRLLKHFRNYHMKNRRPKSYWLGALLVYHIRESLDMSQPLAVLFRDLLDEIYAQYDHLLSTSDTATPNIKDPMLGHNISWNWERSHFETFMRRIDEGRKWATEALEVEDDQKSAVNLWQKVFGEEYFPSEVVHTAKQAALNGLPGQSFVTSSGLVVSSKPTSGLFTRTERTTFHGATKK